jgi:hypothetical protein
VSELRLAGPAVIVAGRRRSGEYGQNTTLRIRMRKTVTIAEMSSEPKQPSRLE